MSKLSQVRKALQEDVRITVVNERKRDFSLKPDGASNDTVSIFVAPREGIYSAEELQQLMVSLVPGLERIMKDDFRDLHDRIEFGVLYFDEVIGQETVRRNIHFNADYLSENQHLTDKVGRTVQTLHLIRRTWVRLFPDEHFAASAFEGQNVCGISKKDLRKKRRTS